MKNKAKKLVMVPLFKMRVEKNRKKEMKKYGKKTRDHPVDIET